VCICTNTSRKVLFTNQTFIQKKNIQDSLSDENNKKNESFLIIYKEQFVHNDSPYQSFKLTCLTLTGRTEKAIGGVSSAKHAFILRRQKRDASKVNPAGGK
jgi:hypothetical protein